MKVLYITYDGLTDPLGRSQVLPYVMGLEAKGVEFVVLSCDKPEKYQAQKTVVESLLEGKKIHWKSVVYKHDIPILSAIDNQKRLQKKAVELMQEYGFDLIHCRSYIPAAIGYRLKKIYHCKWVFDMRGFFPDERVDGKVWNLKNPIYKLVYRYFKKKEYQYFKNADYTVSLTHAGERAIRTFKGLEQIKIQVIPCCADLELFKKEHVLESEQERMKSLLKLPNTSEVYTYLGSLGTWYLPQEMFDFAACYIKQHPQSVFLLITQDDPEKIHQLASQRQIPPSAYRIYPAKREEVPVLLSLCSFSIFFIKSSFSKQASSPTKMGEILSMGLPCVCNSGVGDVAEIVEQAHCGVLINTLDQTHYNQAIETLKCLNYPTSHYRQAAMTYYNLQTAVASYYQIYTTITQD